MCQYKNWIQETGISFEVFNQMLDEILFFDTEANLIYLNPAAERSEGYTLENAYGKSLFELYDFHNDVRKDTSPAYIALTERRHVHNMICTYYTNGLKKTKTISSTPIFKDGILVGAFNIQHDLTQISNVIDENLQLQGRINRQNIGGPQKRQDPFEGLIGCCEHFEYCLSLAKKAGHTDSPVLLIGEDGCGKNTFARSIHNGSSRADKPFLSINCASIPKDLFDSILFGTDNRHYPGPNSEGVLTQVNGGTLYIENITYLPDAIQMKLLHIFEQHMYTRDDGSLIPVDLRIISSSSKSATEIIRSGSLRMEFFYHISVVQIGIPSLRDRKEDIPVLTTNFLSEFNERFHKNISGVSREVMSWFRVYQWPGNIRQFRSCIEAAMNFVEDGCEIKVDDLPANIFYGTGSIGTNTDHSDIPIQIPSQKHLEPHGKKTVFSKRKLYLDAQEKEQEDIIKALEETGGNISQAARLLGISRQLMYYRMRKYHIE